jgi:Tol biopolymer transport system component
MRARHCVLTLGCLLTACGTEPAPPPPPFAGKIVFSSDRATMDGAPVLYTMNPDGSDIRRIPIPLPSALGQADVSPDGERVAFTRDGIYTVGGNGTDLQHPLLSGGGTPAWSPDGTHLACNYTSNGGGTYALWVMDRFGGRKTNLTQTPDYFEFAPTWSPDGALLGYSRQPVDLSTRAQLWVVSFDGSDSHLVVADPVNDALDPAWSPDGIWIAYASGPGVLTNLRSVHPDGTDDHSILQTPDSLAVAGPSWSPDGQSLVFSYGLGIATIHADGTGLQVLTDSAFNADPDWGPALPQ